MLNCILGWRMDRATALVKFQLFQLHKSVGILVLLLSLVRVGWRMANPPPAYPAHMSAREQLLASIAHCLLYALMILLPLTGWVIVSASHYNVPTMLFRTVPWPHIGPIHALSADVRKAVEDQFELIHTAGAWVLIALVVLHVTAALKHHFLDGDDVLTRMLPLLRNRRPGHPTASA